MAKREREYKRVPQYVKSIDDRTVEGVFSVFGNIDSYDDIAKSGSFAKTFDERGDKTLHLWQHDFNAPPTAVIRSLREIDRSELPTKIGDAFPEATGGALVSRTYLDTPRGNEVLTAIKAGAPLEMSYGYDAIRYENEEREGKTIRHLLEQRLWETSDVLWGANSATTAMKYDGALVSLDALLGQLDAWLSSLKDGRRNATGDLGRINAIGLLAYELGATSIAIAPSDDEKNIISTLAKETAGYNAAGEAIDELKSDDTTTITAVAIDLDRYANSNTLDANVSATPGAGSRKETDTPSVNLTPRVGEPNFSNTNTVFKSTDNDVNTENTENAENIKNAQPAVDESARTFTTNPTVNAAPELEKETEPATNAVEQGESAQIQAVADEEAANVESDAQLEDPALDGEKETAPTAEQRRAAINALTLMSAELDLLILEL